MASNALKKTKSQAFSEIMMHQPIRCLILACIFVFGLFDVTSEKMVSLTAMVFVAGAVVATVLIASLFVKKNESKIKYIVKYGAIAVAAVVIFGCLVYISASPNVFGIVALGTIFAITMCLWITKKLNYRRLILILFIAGFVLRVVYILYTTVETRQHDVWYFDSEKYNIGHAGYIEYFYENMHLPDFDPRSMWQYYHPPLHHIIAAIWLKVNTTLGLSYNRAVENIQILTLFYSSACMVVVYKLLREFKITGTAIVVPCAFIAFHPTFIILSGSVNNDVLSICLSFAAALCTVRWYKKKTYGRIILIALTVGGAMMAKLSAALIAPAIAFVFLFVFIRSNGRRWYLFRQFVVFGIICIPLGLWWQIYNYVKFGMPIDYVPMLSLTSDQYIGDIGIFERLFKFDTNQLKPIFIAWNRMDKGANYLEYNVFTALLKTSVFGEFTLFDIAGGQPATTIDKIGYYCCYGLFFSNIAIVLSTIVGMLKMIFSKKYHIDWLLRAFFVVLCAFVLGLYVSFCFQYPHTCTMNMRYAVLLILVSAVSISGLLPKTGEYKNLGVLSKVMTIWSVIAVVAFSAFSSAVYLLVS